MSDTPSVSTKNLLSAQLNQLAHQFGMLALQSEAIKKRMMHLNDCLLIEEAKEAEVAKQAVEAKDNV